MKPTQKLMTRVGAIVISIFVMPTLVQANIEEEQNSPISAANALTASSGEFNVFGSLASTPGSRFAAPIRDVDFYSFFAFSGDTINISVTGAVSTSVALFGVAPDYVLLGSGVASSSISSYAITESGTYTVAVANTGAFFSDGGTVSGGLADPGDYSLSVSGLAMPSLVVDIDVKPKSHKKVARINLKKKRSVKVAILGTADFDVADVDQGSLTFGATGEENTLRKCKRRFKDVNRDGIPDLVCKFRLKGTGFGADSTAAYLNGKTYGGTAFEGRDDISIKNRRKKHHKDDDEKVAHKWWRK